jgi:hypothetical protein
LNTDDPEVDHGSTHQVSDPLPWIKRELITKKRCLINENLRSVPVCRSIDFLRGGGTRCSQYDDSPCKNDMNFAKKLLYSSQWISAVKKSQAWYRTPPTRDRIATIDDQGRHDRLARGQNRHVDATGTGHCPLVE